MNLTQRNRTAYYRKRKALGHVEPRWTEEIDRPMTTAEWRESKRAKL